MTELENILKKMDKKFKTGSIQMGVEFEDIDKIPFSSLRLNYMTYGGLPIGRLAEFSGADGSGKTTTALDLISNAQKKFPDKKALFCDIESTFDSNWATKMNVDIDELILYRPDSQDAEEVFQNLLDIMDTGEISICVLDSIGAMVSGLQNEKSVGEKTYGGISQSLTTFSKKAVPICARTGCVFLGLNQIRDDMNSMYGGTVTTGGRAWRHNCSTRLSFRKGSYIDEKGNNLSRACENPQGNLVTVHLDKSKVCPPDRKVGFYTLKYRTGIDYISDAVDVAVKNGLIHQSGAWFTFVDVETGEIRNDIKLQGHSKVVQYLIDNPDEYETLINSINLGE